ncbi:hypothetical protein EJ04DRAFT_86245 [Polyplosphaeria fusca]|uniref:Uncharacterized protein n=1 Tax=Polyplosphaeria fusca TaxID=682080 RepID=A0A9P4QM02_9PLEO|nr:hypothetical protein EJ04DRAFT_86245 [Polyplosphaeria fusca]
MPASRTLSFSNTLATSLRRTVSGTLLSHWVFNEACSASMPQSISLFATLPLQACCLLPAARCPPILARGDTSRFIQLEIVLEHQRGVFEGSHSVTQSRNIIT